MWDGIKTWLFAARMDICLAGLVMLGCCYLARPKKELWLVGTLAILAFFTATRFGEFQRPGIHAHDVFHYQIGSKYAKELGYTRIYEATGVALKELADSGQIPRNRVQPNVRALADKASPNLPVNDEMAAAVKPYFTPKRWTQFKNDILGYDKTYGLPWGRVVHDAGYNPTPWWSTMGAFVNLFLNGAPSYRWLPVIDLTYLILCLILIYRTFGTRALFYAAAATFFFPPGQYAPFDYTGASMMRLSWVFWLCAGICAFQTKRFVLAGAALGMATTERVFPGAWAAAAGIIVIAQSIANGPKKLESWKPTLQLAAGGLTTTIATVGISCLIYGTTLWTEFIEFIPHHTQLLFTNHFGWAKAISIHPHIQEVIFSSGNMLILREWSEILMSRDNWIIFILIKSALLGGTIIWALRRRDTVAFSFLGAAIVFLFTIPAHYYIFGLLPIYGAVVASDSRNNQNLGAWMLFIAAASTIAVAAGEVAGWVIMSTLVVGAMAYGCGTLCRPNRPVLAGLCGVGVWVFALAYPQLTEAKGPEKFYALIKVDAQQVTRNYIDVTAREIQDRGRILQINRPAKIQTVTGTNHTLNIRTDRFFGGILELTSPEGTLIQRWDVNPMGSIFSTLKTGLPPGKDYQLTWKGPGKDIGIFSIWTETGGAYTGLTKLPKKPEAEARAEMPANPSEDEQIQRWIQGDGHNHNH